MKKCVCQMLAALTAAFLLLLMVPGSLSRPTGALVAQAQGNWETWTVRVNDGYLALRTAKAYDSRNEIGKLWTGDTVQVIDKNDSQYWYVYAPSLGKYGFVNKDYLTGGSYNAAPSVYGTYTVRVESGYLALRSWKEYNSANEIGRLYTGDTVQVTDASDSQYWYVYAPTLGKYGYVNKDYLYGAPYVTGDYTVRVSDGYLALRTAKAYDSRNEIGKLWTGDSVQVIDTNDSQYWYVYAPTLGQYGYVNKDYLVRNDLPSYVSYTVRVSDGYLALRTWKEYNSANEIGRLWTGDVVYATDRSDPQYWYVYAPSLGKYGYVNKDYLY